MDQDLLRFRHAAARENGGRPAIRRRYSPELQDQAVEYCQARRQHGESLRGIAAALGVAEFSLQRWLRRAGTRSTFHPVTVAPVAGLPSEASLVVTLTTDGPRVEGLDVETAARLLQLLR